MCGYLVCCNTTVIWLQMKSCLCASALVAAFFLSTWKVASYT